MSKKKIIDAVQAEYPNLTKKQVGEIIDATFNTISTQLNVKVTSTRTLVSAFGP